MSHEDPLKVPGLAMEEPSSEEETLADDSPGDLRPSAPLHRTGCDQGGDCR